MIIFELLTLREPYSDVKGIGDMSQSILDGVRPNMDPLPASPLSHYQPIGLRKRRRSEEEVRRSLPRAKSLGCVVRLIVFVNLLMMP